MARKTIYTVVEPEVAKKLANGKTFTLNSAMKFLEEIKDEIKKNFSKWDKENDADASIICKWEEEETTQPKGMFNPASIGYRTFRLDAEDNSISYNRFPQHEY